MKVLMINSVCGIRSTGRICTDLADKLEEQGHIVKIAYGRGRVPDRYKKYAVKIGSVLDLVFHGAKARIVDGSGFGSKKATKDFLKWVVEFNPDVIHLHNLHGYYVNVEVLFDYLRNCNKRIIWTLHDCWAFTGHAANCEGVGCNRWMEGCYECPIRHEYPSSFFDSSRINWNKKKELFTNIPNLTIVTPSQWLASWVSRSFLFRYKTIVIYNEINIDVFHPKKSEIKERLGLDKKVVLGVASAWTKNKGLKDFIVLSTMLPSEYQIVLVGLSKKQLRSLPTNIIGIEKTDSADELAEIYNVAEVFVNPTYDDNYPTTNLEAIACGTPVVTYDTGGSPESACYFGKIIKKGDVGGIYSAIINMSFEDKRYPKIFGEGKWMIEYCNIYLQEGENT